MNCPHLRPTRLRPKSANALFNCARNVAAFSLSTRASPSPSTSIRGPISSLRTTHPRRQRRQHQQQQQQQHEHAFAPPTALLRSFATTPALPSGHNRWSKIKHDKAKTDATRTKARTAIANELAVASRLGGSDSPALNPRLAPLIALAKKIGFPKASIASAIARGQGRSSSGLALEALTLEALHAATGVAVLVECATDCKARTMQDLREILKGHGAGEGSVEWMFERRGRVVFEREEAEGGKWDRVNAGKEGEDGVGEAGAAGAGAGAGAGVAKGADAAPPWDEEFVIDSALTAGAMDVEFDDDGGRSFMLLTEPSEMQAVADAMAQALGQAPTRTELAWVPRPEMMVQAEEAAEGSAEAKAQAILEKMLGRVEDEDDVVGVWVNRA